MSLEKGTVITFVEDRLLYGQVLASSSSPFVAVITTDGHFYRTTQAGVATVGQMLPGTQTPFTAADAAWAKIATDTLLLRADAPELVMLAIRTMGHTGLLHKFDDVPNKPERDTDPEPPLRMIDLDMPEKSGHRWTKLMARYMTHSDAQDTRRIQAEDMLRRRAPQTYLVFIAHARMGMSQQEIIRTFHIDKRRVSERIQKGEEAMRHALGTDHRNDTE